MATISVVRRCVYLLAILAIAATGCSSTTTVAAPAVAASAAAAPETQPGASETQPDEPTPEAEALVPALPDPLSGPVVGRYFPGFHHIDANTGEAQLLVSEELRDRSSIYVVRNHDALFLLKDPRGAQQGKSTGHVLLRVELATGEQSELSEVMWVNMAPVGEALISATLQYATATEVVVRLDVGPSGANDHDGAEFLRFDAQTGELLGTFDSLIQSEEVLDVGTCYYRVNDIQLLTDGQLVGSSFFRTPVFVDSVTGALDSVRKCGEPFPSYGDYFDQGDLAALFDSFVEPQFSDHYLNQFFDMPLYPRSNMVEAEGDLWWITEALGPVHTQRGSAVVRFDLATRSVIDVWPVGQAVGIFDHCDPDKSASFCSPARPDVLGWSNGRLVASYERHHSDVYTFDPASGESQNYQVDGYVGSEARVALIHHNGRKAWFSVEPLASPDLAWVAEFDAAAGMFKRVFETDGPT